MKKVIAGAIVEATTMANPQPIWQILGVAGFAFTLVLCLWSSRWGARLRESLGWHAEIGIGVAVASTVFLAFSLVTGLGEPATYISMAVGSLVTALYAERRRRRA